MTANLYQQLSEQVNVWRGKKYPAEQFPTISEILEWAKNPDGSGFQLRPPQVRALETYWHLRLNEKTPHILDLYRKLFSKQSDLLAALGLQHDEIKAFVLDNGMDALFERIKTDDAFVREFHLESLRETLTLSYPSYILALAMGAGKTALIGAIIATEFAMALEYPDGPFVQNALVFAPGTTIIESLRELAQIPYDRILPPRLYKPFAASVKIMFTREGEKDIPVIRGSVFNVVVTNTEKIRIQKETIRKSDIGNLFAPKQEDDARAEIANLRLQAIASLPHLGVFSDEAHHTYGQALDTELKKVRKTVDYLAANTNVICVVNTTGTPYYQRQPLRDVVIWYGLSQGIRDNILKEVGDIQSFNFDDAHTEQFISDAIKDFFKDYGNVTLPNGAPAKLAIYFPQTDDLDELRPAIEATLAKLGLSPSLCLRNTSVSSQTEIDAFNRLNDPAAPHRVILLVNKGTEGWNCPSLFACALARRLKTSNNFVLQAASRCLRQVRDNTKPARIYLSADNRSVLDRQLQETYGETIGDLGKTKANTRLATIQLRKVNLPPLLVKRAVRTVVLKEVAPKPLRLTPVYPSADSGVKKSVLAIGEQKSTKSVLQQVGDTVTVAAEARTVDLYTAAVELAANYRLDIWTVYDELRRIYPKSDEIPADTLPALAKQIEEQCRNYEVREETVERALALVKKDGFQKQTADDGSEFYTAEISYPIDREKLLASWKEWMAKAGALGFHYDPYNFDSNPEQNFFEQLLALLKQHPADVEDIYFTGAITDPSKTDFFVEYKGEDDEWHRYTPDFVVRRKDGKCFIVEIKSERERDHKIDGENGRKAMATRQLVGLNPDRLKYEIIFTPSDVIGHEQLEAVREFIEN